MSDMIQKLEPLRSGKYKNFVRSLECVVTGQIGCEAHHIKGDGFGGTTKCSDLFTIPLTPIEHRVFHDIGWQTWELSYGSQMIYVLKTIEKAQKAGIIKIGD